jgi:hypothetical protein
MFLLLLILYAFQSADSFAKSMITLVEQPDELPRMKNLSKKHVAVSFHRAAFYLFNSLTCLCINLDLW